VSTGREFKGAVAPAKEGVREEEQARGRKEVTRGGRGSRRWSGDGGRAAARGKALRWRQKGGGGRAEQGNTCPSKKKRGRGSGGPI
jgi:hypothetical protein